MFGGISVGVCVCVCVFVLVLFGGTRNGFIFDSK